MFTYTGTIKDTHGIEHTNPVFEVLNFNSQCSTDMSSSYDVSTGERHDNESENRYVNYTITYWPNQAAKDAGNRPITFNDNNGNSNFYFQPEVSYTTTTQVLAEIESKFLSEVLITYIQSVE